MWTLFWDMSSGGSTKEAPYHYIYIEATKEEAKIIFFNRFGHNPDRVSCTCCGEDYSICEDKTVELASAYHRKCEWNKEIDEYDIETAKISLKDYENQNDILFIRESEIKPEEKTGSIPEQGYIWVD